MLRMTLYQVSDIHFPDVRLTRALDVKDPGFSSSVLGALGPSPLVGAMRELVRRTSADPACALAICGDLTSVGSLDGYRACVEYLVSSLDLASANWPLEALHAV